MANPVFEIRNTGRNSARVGDVQELADHICTSWTSATTGTIAVTADATYDVSFTQPADTIIRNLIAIPAGNIVTAGASGDDVDFDLGTAAGGGATARVFFRRIMRDPHAVLAPPDAQRCGAACPDRPWHAQRPPQARGWRATPAAGLC